MGIETKSQALSKPQSTFSSISTSGTTFYHFSSLTGALKPHFQLEQIRITPESCEMRLLSANETIAVPSRRPVSTDKSRLASSSWSMRGQ
jgi:hypothetical protein